MTLLKALIFGASGQDGYYLNNALLNMKIEVICISRCNNTFKGDVSKLKDVENFIKCHKPEYIFHLAAKSSTSHESLFENNETISTGTLNILESVYKYSPLSKVFITGSGVQFKNNGVPISEKDYFDANSAYSVSRISSVYMARYYRQLGIKTYIGYLFHHESPFRKSNHMSKKIVDFVKRIDCGDEKILTVGDITVEKEWTFAGDVVNGILTLVMQDMVFEATIGSGLAFSIKQWIEECFSLTSGCNWRNYIEIDTSFIPEYKKLVSDPATINTLGWQPQVSFKELAKMMMD